MLKKSRGECCGPKGETRSGLIHEKGRRPSPVPEEPGRGSSPRSQGGGRAAWVCGLPAWGLSVQMRPVRLWTRDAARDVLSRRSLRHDSEAAGVGAGPCGQRSLEGALGGASPLQRWGLRRQPPASRPVPNGGGSGTRRPARACAASAARVGSHADPVSGVKR